MGDLNGIHINGCRCNERLKAKTEGSKLLTYTVLMRGRRHLYDVTSTTSSCLTDKTTQSIGFPCVPSLTNLKESVGLILGKTSVRVSSLVFFRL